MRAMRTGELLSILSSKPGLQITKVTGGGKHNKIFFGNATKGIPFSRGSKDTISVGVILSVIHQVANHTGQDAADIKAYVEHHSR